MNAILRQWLSIVGLQGIAAAAAIGTAAIAAIAVPPATFGLYSLMLSTVQIAYGIGFAWLNHALFRFAREEFVQHGSVGASLRVALAVYVILVCVAALLLMVWARPLAQWLAVSTTTLVWCLLALAALALFETSTYAAQAGGRFRGYGMGQVLVKSGPLLAVAGFAAGLQGGAVLLILGAITGWIAALLLTLPTVSWRGPSGPAPIRSMLAYGWKLPLGTGAGVITTWLGVWFVHGHMGIEDAGRFAWATSLFGIVAAILIPLSAVLAPGLVDLHVAGDRTAIARRVRQTLTVATLAIALLPLALVALRAIGEIIVPEQYRPAVPLLTILCAAAPAQLLSYALAPLLLADTALIGRAVAINVVIAMLAALGNAVLVPLLGSSGAALAMLAAQWIGSIAWLTLAGRAAGYHGGLWQWLTGAVLAMASAVMATALPVWVAVPSAAALAAAILICGRQAGWFNGIEFIGATVPGIRTVVDLLQRRATP